MLIVVSIHIPTISYSIPSSSSQYRFFKNCTLSIFSKPSVDQLKAFIAARNYPDKERYVTPPGNKGTLKEAQEGVMKLIRFAYDWRERAIVVEHQDLPTDITDSEESVTSTAAIHTVKLTSVEATVLLSELLSDEERVRNKTTSRR